MNQILGLRKSLTRPALSNLTILSNVVWIKTKRKIQFNPILRSGNLFGRNGKQFTTVLDSERIILNKR